MSAAHIPSRPERSAPARDVTLILGGARSGKTSRALSLASHYADRIMIATAEAHDDEMAERIAHHRLERGDAWRTLEAPLDLAGALFDLVAEAASQQRTQATPGTVTNHATGGAPVGTSEGAPVSAPVGADARSGAVAVVDCLTLWLTNLMLAQREIATETERLIAALNGCHGRLPVILVSNEVGLGLVPDTPLGRAFRDAQGRLNQRLAQVADRVEFIAAGLPMTLKP